MGAAQTDIGGLGTAATRKAEEYADRFFSRQPERRTAYRDRRLPAQGWDQRQAASPLLPEGDTTQRTIRAIQLLGQLRAELTYLPSEGATPVEGLGVEWLAHAQGHLTDQLAAHLRGVPYEPRAPRTEGEALAVVKSISKGLDVASGYLLEAAHRLRDINSDSHGASVTHQHHLEILDLYHGIAGSADPDPADPS